MRTAARKPTKITARKQRRTARNNELYSAAFRIAWRRISSRRKREQWYVALLLHASIRRQLKKGATDPSVIASKALEALNERSPAATRTFDGKGTRRGQAHRLAR